MLFTLGAFLVGTAGFTYHEHTCISRQHTDVHVVQFAGEPDHDYDCCSHDHHQKGNEQPASGTSIQCCTDSYSQVELDETFLDTGKKLSNKPLAQKLLFPFQLSLNIKLSGLATAYRHVHKRPPLIPENHIYHLSSLLL